MKRIATCLLGLLLASSTLLAQSPAGHGPRLTTPVRPPGLRRVTPQPDRPTLPARIRRFARARDLNPRDVARRVIRRNRLADRPRRPHPRRDRPAVDRERPVVDRVQPDSVRPERPQIERPLTADGRPFVRPPAGHDRALQNRLAAIDRMRDRAAESGNVALLRRADELERLAREHVARVADRLERMPELPPVNGRRVRARPVPPNGDFVRPPITDRFPGLPLPVPPNARPRNNQQPDRVPGRQPFAPPPTQEPLPLPIDGQQ